MGMSTITRARKGAAPLEIIQRTVAAVLGGYGLAWAANVMFLAWAALAIHAALRPAVRVWAEQCWIAAAFGLIPLVNALTTDRHLGASLPAGQWELAAVDLTCLAFGLGFIVAARIAARRHQRAVQAKEISPTLQEAAE